MAIYELDGQRPDLPADERYWVAESAVVIGTGTQAQAQLWALPRDGRGSRSCPVARSSLR